MLSRELPTTMLVTEGQATDEDPQTVESVLAAVRLAVEHDVSLVQVREKRLAARSLFRLVETALDITRPGRTKLLVNDRADIAAAAGADGVHLRSDSLPSAAVRAAFPQLLIGRSVHGIDEAERAASEGADFAVFGPVFTTPGKTAVGLTALEEVCRRLEGFPIIAIGGIDADTVGDVIAAGASGFAAIRSMSDPASLKHLITSPKG